MAQLCYYINRSDKLKANESSDLLTELMHPTAYNPQWEKFILSVAGDPRIPKDHVNYRKWWSYLGNKRIEKVLTEPIVLDK